MRKILNLASFEVKKFSPSFRFKAKIIKSKQCEKFKAKNRLEFCFALFRFEAKTTKVKRSEKFEAKTSEKKQKNISEIL
jgi:penicillin-binding protein-related factor A (putative recombinase)